MAMTFDYKVRDRAGALVEGEIEGDSMALVVRRLREMGYMPVSVAPKSAVSLKTEIKIPGFSDRIKMREVAVVTRQLATMVDSGLVCGPIARNPRGPGRQPGTGQGARRGAPRSGARLVAVGRLRQAPEGLLAPLLHPGAGWRGRREPRRGPA